MNREIVYQIVDLFLAGMAAMEIASRLKKTTLEIMEILQCREAEEYADKIRELRRMELEALADGPATDVVRDSLESGPLKEKLQAADMTFKAVGKYKTEDSAVVTLAKILERVMEESK